MKVFLEVERKLQLPALCQRQRGSIALSLAFVPIGSHLPMLSLFNVFFTTFIQVCLHIVSYIVSEIQGATARTPLLGKLIKT